MQLMQSKVTDPHLNADLVSLPEIFLYAPWIEMTQEPQSNSHPKQTHQSKATL